MGSFRIQESTGTRRIFRIRETIDSNGRSHFKASSGRAVVDTGGGLFDIPSLNVVEAIQIDNGINGPF